MSTNYPGSIDNSNNLPPAQDNQTPVSAKVFNNLRGAVISIESTLGVQPNGAYGTVAGRLITLEGLIANTPIIQLTEDLGGTPNSPLVVGIQGRPVSDAGPGLGQTLIWNGISWVPSSVVGGVVVFSQDLSGNSTAQTVIGLQNRPLSSAVPATGQMLAWNGSTWIPSTLSGDVTGSAVSNTVIKIQGQDVPVPTGTNTSLKWTGSALVWA